MRAMERGGTIGHLLILTALYYANSSLLESSTNTGRRNTMVDPLKPPYNIAADHSKQVKLE